MGKEGGEKKRTEGILLSHICMSERSKQVQVLRRLTKAECGVLAAAPFPPNRASVLRRTADLLYLPP
jgi:hypothetical protein